MAGPVPPPPPSAAGARAAAALVCVDFLARASYGMARTPLLPLYAAFLGAGPEMIGFVGAASTVTGVILKLPAGALSDAVGKRNLLLAGLLVFGTGPFLYFLAAGPWSLAGIRFYHGLATAVYSPVAMAVIARLAGERRGEYLSWLSNAKTMGGLVGAALGGVVLSFTFAGVTSIGRLFTLEGLRSGFRGALPSGESLARGDFTIAYLVCGALGAVALGMGVVASRPFAEPEIAERRRGRDAWRRLLLGIREIGTDRRILAISTGESIQNITVGILEQFLPLYAVLVAGRSPLEAGLLYVSQAVTTFLAKPILGRWSDRRGRRGLVLAGMLICALPFAAIPWTRDFLALCALSVLFGLGEALVTSSAAAYVADACKERSLGAAMGAFGTIGDAGHALGPILGGFLIGIAAAGATPGPGAYRFAFGVVAALLVASVPLVARVTKAGA